jgi:hypothetical protein
MSNKKWFLPLCRRLNLHALGYSILRRRKLRNSKLVMNEGVQVVQAIVPALPLSYSPVVGEIGVEPMTWRISGVYARAVGVRRRSYGGPGGDRTRGLRDAIAARSGCATGP